MSLRSKTLLVMAATLVSLVLLLYGALSTIVLSGFAAVEEQETRQNVQRVEEAITAEQAKLNLTAQDWAEWDETYAFIEDGNDSYRQSNLDDATIARLQMSLELFVDSSGQVVFSTGF